MRKLSLYLFLPMLFIFKFAVAQTMPSGFDAAEYVDLLRINITMIGDASGVNDYNLNKGIYHRQFRSPEVGLYNLCEVYVRNNNTAIISLRGTVGKAESWMENFYCGMVPANGQLQLNDSTTFNYNLSQNNDALVHIGWLTGLGFLSAYINQQLEPLLAKGITNIIVMGHSQGGALAFLTTSYLYYKYHNQYPAMQIKTYASAAPKPGNLYYAYDFDFITRNGYGYRIVNAADWVPESPICIQTIGDFNKVNPLTDGKKALKKQKFFLRLALNHVYNQLDKSTYKAMKKYRKYLGSFLYKQVKKTLTQYPQANYSYSMNYSTAGSPVILAADSAYHAAFPFNGKNMFTHHLLKPYLYLVKQHYQVE